MKTMNEYLIGLIISCLQSIEESALGSIEMIKSGKSLIDVRLVSDLNWWTGELHGYAEILQNFLWKMGGN